MITVTFENAMEHARPGNVKVQPLKVIRALQFMHLCVSESLCLSVSVCVCVCVCVCVMYIIKI